MQSIIATLTNGHCRELMNVCRPRQSDEESKTEQDPAPAIVKRVSSQVIENQEIKPLRFVKYVGDHSVAIV